MDRKITMGSLFSGSGGFELAGSMYGIDPVWASEIEPFPIRVTEERFPNMEHLGDISKLNGAELEPVDIITGGSPCQDMSIAGKREGLDGSRSGLFHEQIRIITEMRKAHGKPRFMVWENVPGAFSSNKGQDFRAVLEEIAGVKQPGIAIPEPERKGNGGLKWNTSGTIMGNGFSIAWRVFDAQYWGVAQRRKRIYLVADFDGGCAGKILFKPESLPWDIEKSAEAWQRASSCSEKIIGETGWNLHGCVPVDYHPQDSRIQIADGDKTQTLTGQMGTGGGNVPLTMVPVTMQERSGCDGGGKGILLNIEKSSALRASYNQSVFEPAALDKSNQKLDKTAPTLRGAHGGETIPCVMEKCLTPWDVQSRRIYREDGTWPSLYAGEGGGHGYVAIRENEVFPIADKATRCKGGGNTRNEDGAGNGLGIGDSGAPAYTLTAGDRHAVAYSFDKAAYNQGEHSSYGIGLMEEVAHTLTAGWQPPAVAYGIQQNASGELRSSKTSAILSTNGNASGRNAPLVMQTPTYTCDCRNYAVNEEISGTLQAKENGGHSLNYINPVAVPEIAGTLTAKMAKGTGGPAGEECQNLVAELPEYKIRRLTPMECCRLQGFPDGWTEGLAISEPDENMIDKWEAVFEEHRKVTGEPKNPRKRSQIIKWLKDPYSDTALYRMWGNGIALPCAAFVMKGIAQEIYGEQI